MAEDFQRPEWDETDLGDGLRGRTTLELLHVALPGPDAARRRGRQRTRHQALGTAGGVAVLAAVAIIGSTSLAGTHPNTVDPGVSTSVSTPAPTTTATTTPAPATSTAAPVTAAPPTTAAPVTTGSRTTTPVTSTTTGGAAVTTSTAPAGLVNAVNGFGTAKSIVDTATGSCLRVDLHQLLTGSAADAWLAAHPHWGRMANYAVDADPDGPVLHCIPVAANVAVTLTWVPPTGSLGSRPSTLTTLRKLLLNQLPPKGPLDRTGYWLQDKFYRWHLDSAGAIDRLDAYYTP